MNGDPLDPIRSILDHLATTTEPPCNHLVWVEAYRQAVNDISEHAYPEPSEGTPQ